MVHFAVVLTVVPRGLKSFVLKHNVDFFVFFGNSEVAFNTLYIYSMSLCYINPDLYSSY